MDAYPSLGSVSAGTLLPSDLLFTFASELEDLTQRNAKAWCSDHGRLTRDRYIDLVRNAREVDAEEDPDSADDLLSALTDALNDFAPDYCYFGAHPGDGADFGYWLIEDWQQQMDDDGTLVVDDLSGIPDDYRGLACVVNDHGNATMYAVDADDIRRELWSCV